jgi:hypothetical protein
LGNNAKAQKNNSSNANTSLSALLKPKKEAYIRIYQAKKSNEDLDDNNETVEEFSKELRKLKEPQKESLFVKYSPKKKRHSNKNEK